MAMEVEKEECFCLYETRTEIMVSPKEGKPAVRLARFLKPCAKTSDQDATGRFPILPQSSSQEVQEWHPKFHFKGWKKPQRKWDEWVDSLAGNYALTWNQAGLCDAILGSLYEIPCNPDLILGLVEYWCPETNTFVFPWGEATITLEDVVILGGFSVHGEPVTCPLLTEDLLVMEAKLQEIRKQILKGKSKKVDHGSWIRFFMEEQKSHEFEHVGFLSLWLSRFVFPSLPEFSIGNHVFPIAIHLSQGKRMALAPAVLASLYNNLRLLKEQEVPSTGESMTVLGLFQIVQLWVFERFPILGPKKYIELKLGEPRVARWNKLGSYVGITLLKSVLKSAYNFQWRPYVADLKNWCFVSHYKDNEQLVDYSWSSEEAIRSFGLCLRAAELVGLGCIEKYMPHRVAMQFGMDQDLPGEFAVMPPNWRENITFYVPAKCYKPSVSLSYLNWWKESMVINDQAEDRELNREIANSNGMLIEDAIGTFNNPLDVEDYVSGGKTISEGTSTDPIVVG